MAVDQATRPAPASGQTRNQLSVLSQDSLRGNGLAGHSFPPGMTSATPARTSQRTRRNDVAFVLAGGASYAAVQVGMLRALNQFGVYPDLLVGASAGALNAAAYAANPTAEGIELLTAAWIDARRSDLFPLRATALFRGLTGRRNYVIDTDNLRRWLVDHVALDNLEDAKVPLHIVATDLADGTPTVLSKGSTVQALLASSAIPGIFPPVSVGGRLLVDGGIAADSPVREARNLGAGTIYLLPSHAIGGAVDTRSALAMGSYAYSQVFAHWTDDQAADDHGSVHVLPVPAASLSHPLDLKHSAALIEAASELTFQWLTRPDRTRGSGLQRNRETAVEEHHDAGYLPRAVSPTDGPRDQSNARKTTAELLRRSDGATSVKVFIGRTTTPASTLNPAPDSAGGVPMPEGRYATDATFERTPPQAAFEVLFLTRVAMLDLVEHLVHEFADLHSAGHVIRHAYRTREMLLAQGLRSGLIPATEAATRRQLTVSGISPVDDPSSTHDSRRPGYNTESPSIGTSRPA
jgi:NTE family protein